MISDEWTIGGVVLVVWVVLASGVVHLIEQGTSLRASFRRAGILLAMSGAFWFALVVTGVPL